MSDVPTTTTTTTPGVEPKPVDITETPEVITAVPEKKEEDTSAVPETTAAGAVEDTPVVPETVAEDKKEEVTTSDAEKKADGFLTKFRRILSKSPIPTKKDKKKEEEPVVTEEVNKVQEETPAAVVETVTEPVKEEVEELPKPVAEVAAAVEEAPKKTSSKFSRRLSARVGDLFKQRSKQEVPSTARVDEHPPIIEVPKPVAPLDNPASDDANTSVVKPVEPVQSATPVVIAAA